MSSESPERTEQHQGAVAVWRTSDLAENFLVQTSLPQEDPAHRSAILEIIDSECRRGSDLIGQQFWISEYLVHPVPLTDQETGEITIARRCVFPQPDGTPISFVSEGVIRSLEKICWAVKRDPPWDPPVRVLLKQVSTRKGFRTFKLIPVSG